MNLQEKKDAIKKITNRLRSGHEDFSGNSSRKVCNTGYTFFVTYSAGVLRDVVAGCRERYGIPVEILDYEVAYFAGSEEKANALQEAFGGYVRQSEWPDIYTWEGLGRENLKPYGSSQYLINLDEAREVLALV